MLVVAQWLRHAPKPTSCGVLQAGSGFWLQHSAPKFPQPAAGPAAGDYTGVAPAQRVFGQHFLCLTLGAGGIETVAAALRTAFPLVFSRQIPAETRGTLPQVGWELPSPSCVGTAFPRSWTLAILQPQLPLDVQHQNGPFVTDSHMCTGPVSLARLRYEHDMSSSGTGGPALGVFLQ